MLLAGAIFVTAAAVPMAQNDQPAHPLPLAEVDDKAKNVIKDNRATIRAYVDAMFADARILNAPESVKNRVSNAEHRFRNGEHRAITEQEFADAANDIARIYGAPDFMLTNGAQVHLFRELMRRLVPNAIGKAVGSREMTPAEAVLVALNLGKQKLINDDYRVNADAWVASAAKLRNSARPTASQGGARVDVRVELPEITRMTRYLRETPGTENTLLAQAVHLFLDHIGVQR